MQWHLKETDADKSCENFVTIIFLIIKMNDCQLFQWLDRMSTASSLFIFITFCLATIENTKQPERKVVIECDGENTRVLNSSSNSFIWFQVQNIEYANKEPRAINTKYSLSWLNVHLLPLRAYNVFKWHPMSYSQLINSTSGGCKFV